MRKKYGLYLKPVSYPDIALSGEVEAPTEEADVDGVMAEIKAVLAEEQARKERLQEQD